MRAGIGFLITVSDRLARNRAVSTRWPARDHGPALNCRSAACRFRPRDEVRQHDRRGPPAGMLTGPASPEQAAPPCGPAGRGPPEPGPAPAPPTRPPWSAPDDHA